MRLAFVFVVVIVGCTRRADPAAEDMAHFDAGEVVSRSLEDLACLQLPYGRDIEIPKTDYDRHHLKHPAFAIDRRSASCDEWKACIAAGACREHYMAQCNVGVMTAEAPEALQYCHWRHAELPTFAEWLRAARGAAPHTYPWGDVWDPQQACKHPTDIRNGYQRCEYTGERGFIYALNNPNLTEILRGSSCPDGTRKGVRLAGKELGEQDVAMVGEFRCVHEDATEGSSGR